VRKESTGCSINMTDVACDSKSYVHIETFVNNLLTDIDI